MQAQHSPTQADANRIDWLARMNSLEMQAGVRRILTPEPKRLPGLNFNCVREGRKAGQEILRDVGIQISSAPICLTRPARMSSRTRLANRAISS